MPLRKQCANSYLSTWALLALLCLLLQGCSSNLQLWHSRILSGEYEAGLDDKVDTLEQYLQLEEALFQQLDNRDDLAARISPQICCRSTGRASLTTAPIRAPACMRATLEH